MALPDSYTLKPGAVPAYFDAILVSVREHIESCESFVIQEWWPDSRRVADVDEGKSRTL